MMLFLRIYDSERLYSNTKSRDRLHLLFLRYFMAHEACYMPKLTFVASILCIILVMLQMFTLSMIIFSSGVLLKANALFI